MKDPNSFMDNIKSQMTNLDKSTTKPNWERVAQTLKRNKRRRYATWLISSLGSLTVLVLFFNQCNPSSTNTLAAPIQQEQTQIESSKTSVAKTVGDSSLNSDADPEVSKTTAEQKMPSNSRQTSNKTNSENASITQNNTSRNNTIQTVDSVDFIEGAAVKTTYYYYNDHNNVQVVTSDRAVIDSIMKIKSNQKVVDSIKK